MSLWELFVIAVGLSMDACAVAVCKGLAVGRAKAGHCISAGGYFGGFQMSMQELGTLRQHDIPVKMVVFRNDSLGLVRQIQKQDYQGRYEAVDLVSPDLAALAAVYGVRCATVRHNDEIEETVARMLADSESFFVQVLVSPDEGAL